MAKDTPRGRRALLALLVQAFLGCHTTDVVGTITGDLGDAPPDQAQSGNPNNPDLAGSQDYCAGQGPPVLVTPQGGQAGQACTGRLAQVAFRYGLCTCSAFNAGAAVTVDSYDSQRAMSPGSLGGSVGLNGSMSTSQAVDIGGSLWIGSANGANFTSLRVGQELRSASSTTGSVRLSVGGNAYVNGDVNLGGALDVGGILTVPAGRTISAPMLNAPRVVRAPVSVPPPCDCSPESQIDIAGYLKSYQASNDNKAIFLDPDRLINFNSDTTLTLPCGRYYLSAVNGGAALTLKIDGRVALFIGGDMTLPKDFTVTLGAAGQLDLFIGGTINAGGNLNLGTPETASRLRIYVNSESGLALSGAVTLAGNLYAPKANLNVGGALTVYGALFVKNVATPAPVTIHHDVSILRAGEGCPPPPAACQSCRDCGNQACTGGTCGRCTSDSDCCSPLQCRGGQCVYILG